MPSSVNPTEAILAAEHRALQRWSAGDPEGYAETAADDVTYFDDIGAQARVEGREALLAYFSGLKGQIPVHRYEMVDPKVQLVGDVGILTFRYHASSPDGTAFPPWKATAVYRQVGRTWRLVHAHWSMVKLA
ncbi:MAG: nuclear transport factor 2 family protein [Gemmatimonadota bacterium]|nr:nuclear transport factor 2 family protein [Gemmatimonadota bacterium]MDH4351098.1 nuclear transport factor 2 family protein [Gemmatimonadota bacterium]MDH5199064.1 nuclear transport factor 2 family protein [Gemmatimonadota bacterium]